MSDAVDYLELTPTAFRARLAAAPIAYLPLGTLEWHGEHLPLGADALQSHGFFPRLAARAGGIVLPPFFLGPRPSAVHLLARRGERKGRAGADDGPRGANETSITMALYPDLVHMEYLSNDPAVPPVAVAGRDPRSGASAGLGQAILATQEERMAGLLREALRARREE